MTSITFIWRCSLCKKKYQNYCKTQVTNSSHRCVQYWTMVNSRIWYACSRLLVSVWWVNNWLYLCNKQLDKYRGGARCDNICDANPWNNTCRGTQETWRITSFLERFGHVHNKGNNQKSTKQTNVLFNENRRCRSYKNMWQWHSCWFHHRK